MRSVFIAALLAAPTAWSTPSLPAVVSAGSSFTCTAVAVWDGDGPIWCAEGPKIRLAGVAAREIDGTCRRYQPCPAAGGVEARDALVDLLGGARGTRPSGHVTVAPVALRCLSEGSGKGERTAAWCAAPAVGDLSCALVARGVALRWDRYWRDGQCGEVRRAISTGRSHSSR